MKKALKMKGRNLVSFMLIIAMMLSMTTNVFASWVSYNTGVVYLEETWIGSKQCINFYSNGQWIRNVAGENHTLWINSVPSLYNMYDTGYWCFDKYGNTWVINTSQSLLLCKANSTTFVVNTVVSGCTGFQRDSGKVGYLVYTNNGSYSLEDLLNNNYSSVNSNNYSMTEYPYVDKPVNYFKYHASSNREYYYYLSDYKLYYLGTNNKSEDILITDGVMNITFTKNYVVYVTITNSVYAYPVGKTSLSYRINVGTNFSYFDEQNFMSNGYCDLNGIRQPFNINNNYYNYDYDDYYYDDNEYPCIEKSGSYYYVRKSSTKYYKYYYYNSKLYYYGTNSGSANTLISSSVKNITFDIYNGYIVYALSTTNNEVYALPFGITSSTYRVKIGSNFKSFDKYYGTYCSKGYTSTTGYYRSFSDYYDGKYKEEFPYVEFDGNYFYIYISSSRYYVYYLNSSGYLYYKGTNSSSINTKIASKIEEIRFSPEGYIAYANKDGEVNSLPLGKTSSSYEKYQGNRFSYFDDDDGDYLCDGYINNRGTCINFDFD